MAWAFQLYWSDRDPAVVDTLVLLRKLIPGCIRTGEVRFPALAKASIFFRDQQLDATDRSRDGKVVAYSFLTPNVGCDAWAMPMSAANASPIGRSNQPMSAANASPIGRSNQPMSAANASPI